MKRAVLICFSIESRKFRSNYERSKFFKALYGWKQVIPKRKKVYIYKREGLLDLVPHFKVDQSSFIIPKKFFDRIIEFLREWEDKVIWRSFEVLINEEIEKMFKEFEKEFGD
jgi:hypothetical protein